MAATAPPPDSGHNAKREPKKVLLRLDPAVHEAIAKWAADDLRSVNGQLEYALRMALKQVGRLPE
ncbi:MAG: hypothetical protein QM728_13400 [Gordonia sp. (in: high G+C Gram-positive bacteria)]|uniref:hypothetical protein n=1 Tax=Gordonia sp. (in: high G+C Gram-positive bacteria) TaxID=84139 RepID=UPI0039E532AF